MSAPGADDVVIAAREGLLDALEALGPQRESLILIGAQAIYLHTGDAPVAIAPYTTDADIALDTRELQAEPLIEEAMRGAGFTLDLNKGQPGAWVSPHGVPVDLMVAEAQAGARGRRAARVPPHDRAIARRAVGLEGALVDNSVLADPAGSGPRAGPVSRML